MQEYTTTYTRLEHSSGELLERLVKFCTGLLTLFSNEQPEYADDSNQFRLWGLAVKSEYLYKALDHDMIGSRNVQWQDLIDLLFRSIIRIGKVLGRPPPL